MFFFPHLMEFFVFAVQQYGNDDVSSKMYCWRSVCILHQRFTCRGGDFEVSKNSVTEWRVIVSHSFNNLKMIFVYVPSILLISSYPLCQVALGGRVRLLSETGSPSSLFIHFVVEIKSIAKMECKKSSGGNRFTLIIFVLKLFLFSFPFSLSQNWTNVVSWYQIIHLWMGVVSLNAVALLYFDPFVDNL